MPDLKSSPPLQLSVMGVNFLKKESFGILKPFNQGVMPLSYLCISTILVGAISTFLRST